MRLYAMQESAGLKILKALSTACMKRRPSLNNVRWPDRRREPLLYLSGDVFRAGVACKAMERKLWLFGCRKDACRQSCEKPVTVRCVHEDQVPQIRQILEAEGVTVTPGSLVNYALKLSGFDHLSGLKSFRDGLYTVQDESSMMVVEMAGLKAGDTVIDVCAAPGGKSCHARRDGLWH